MKKVLLLIFIFIFSCSKRENINLLKKEYPHLSFYIDKVANMTLEERRGILLMVGIKDKVLSEETIKVLKDNHIMGVILFDYNIESEVQLKQLTKDLREKVNPNLIISVDQEGGEVNRIKFDKLKYISQKDIGDSNSVEYADYYAREKSKFLLDLGINMLLGPVCDIASDSNSYLYNRSFSINVGIVSNLVYATVSAQKSSGIMSVLKHFPGHGDTIINSHKEFPVINKSLEKLKTNEFIPFISGIDAGAEFILVGHIENKYIDKKNISSMSRKYLNILENELGFDGVIITDNLAMTGNIKRGINFGINLISNVYENVSYMFKKLNPDIIVCAKILKIIEDNRVYNQ